MRWSPGSASGGTQRSVYSRWVVRLCWVVGNERDIFKILKPQPPAHFQDQPWLRCLLSRLLSPDHPPTPLFIPDPGKDTQLRFKGVPVNVTADTSVDPLERRRVGILMKNYPAEPEALAKAAFHLRLLSQVHFRHMRRFAFFNPAFLQLVNEHGCGVEGWEPVGVTVGRYAYDLSLDPKPALLPDFCAAFRQPAFGEVANGDYMASRMPFTQQWADILFGGDGRARRFCRRFDFPHFQRVPLQFFNHVFEVGGGVLACYKHSWE